MSDFSSLSITANSSDAIQGLRALESQLKKTLDMASKLNESLSSIGLNKNLTSNLKLDVSASKSSTSNNLVGSAQALQNNTQAFNEITKLNTASEDLAKSLKSNRKNMMGMKNNIMLLNTGLLGSSEASKVFSGALGVLVRCTRSCDSCD